MGEKTEKKILSSFVTFEATNEKQERQDNRAVYIVRIIQAVIMKPRALNTLESRCARDALYLQFSFPGPLNSASGM